MTAKSRTAATLVVSAVLALQYLTFLHGGFFGLVAEDTPEGYGANISPVRLPVWVARLLFRMGPVTLAPLRQFAWWVHNSGQRAWDQRSGWQGAVRQSILPWQPGKRSEGVDRSDYVRCMRLDGLVVSAWNTAFWLLAFFLIRTTLRRLRRPRGSTTQPASGVREQEGQRLVP
jgi:hypothetical protein